jgi:DNA-directed RNA polymerase subunit RPC12/RpoP
MPSKAKTLSKRNSQIKTPTRTKTTEKPTTRTVPRCAKCGSKTVRLEQLQQELLAVLAVHCLICGHHTFVGKPIVRLIRRPDIPESALEKIAPETSSIPISQETP